MHAAFVMSGRFHISNSFLRTIQNILYTICYTFKDNMYKKSQTIQQLFAYILKCRYIHLEHAHESLWKFLFEFRKFYFKASVGMIRIGFLLFFGKLTICHNIVHQSLWNGKTEYHHFLFNTIYGFREPGFLSFQQKTNNMGSGLPKNEKEIEIKRQMLHMNFAAITFAFYYMCSQR